MVYVGYVDVGLGLGLVRVSTEVLNATTMSTETVKRDQHQH